MKGKIMFMALIALALFLGGCLKETQQTDVKLETLTQSTGLSDLSQETAIDLCVNACQEAKANDTFLALGPCLLNPINTLPDWVCDVAHSPRQEADNNPANQCSAFGKGASHFVEVDPDCGFIRAV